MNAADDPWIPVRFRNGSASLLSLRATLLRSHEIVAIDIPEPASFVAVIRLLLAVLHRVLVTEGLKPSRMQRALCLKEGLPAEAIQRYLDRWRHRFELFAPDAPFFQVPALRSHDATRDQVKSAGQILLASASGAAPTLSDHALDAAPKGWRPEALLPHLLAYLQTTPGGLVRVFKHSDRAGPLANSAAVLPQGDGLQETLLLCLHPPQSDDEEPDLPCWEQAVPGIDDLTGPDRRATGPNDRYTRLTRAVLLRRDEDGLVRHIHFGAGLTLSEDPTARDPMVAHRRSKEGGLIRLTFGDGRAFWRDLAALLPEGEDPELPPTVMRWAADLRPNASRRVRQAFAVIVAGLASDQAKLERWRLERHVLPAALLEDGQSAVLLKRWLAVAEDVHGVLRRHAQSAMLDLLPGTGGSQPSKEARKEAAAAVAASMLSPAFFLAAGDGLVMLLDGLQQALDAVSRGSDVGVEREHARERWHRHLSRSALQAWERWIASLGASTSVLMAQAQHRPKLERELASMLPMDLVAKTAAHASTP